MAVVKCVVEWESDNWSYIVLQGNEQLKYTKIPSLIIVDNNNEKYIYVEVIEDKGESYKCKLRDIRYKDYDFINFCISKDQFVDDVELETVTKQLYKIWCNYVLD